MLRSVAQNRWFIYAITALIVAGGGSLVAGRARRY